ncbi:MAG: PilZ domain-containing protein [Firmicutes bacterium]|nr:PilZ domain-containing protein [Bacillota bacterium]
MQAELLDIIRTGQIVYIEDDEGQSWPFGVNNILSRELVVCSALGRKSTPLKAAQNMVTIVVPEENGAYLIEAALVEADENNCRMILKPTGKAEQVQRRQYFRVSKPSALVHYQLVNDDVSEEIMKPVEGMVWDLSGNGIGMVIRSTKTIYADSEIKLSITLPGESPVEIIGKVVRVVPRSIIKNEYLLGVTFKKYAKRTGIGYLNT